MSVSPHRAEDSAPVLSVEGLTVRFAPRKGQELIAVDQLDFAVRRGETLAIVGESGCGKSLTALALMGLVPKPGKVDGRAIRLEGRDILGLAGEAMRRLRGNRIAMIFQEPMTALNPVLTIGEQIVEAIREHEDVSWTAARARTLELLDRVRISNPSGAFDDYPHRLSGGMRQRVVIAMALAASPAVLVADEPTTALDVTIQAQILALLDELKHDIGTAIVLITHDLGIVAEHADRVLVMYAGRKVEERPAAELFERPLHPYTRGLMLARPRFGQRAAERTRLDEIPGRVPSLAEMPAGCRFAPRCGKVTDACRQASPPNVRIGDGVVACLRIEDQHVAEPAFRRAGSR